MLNEQHFFVEATMPIYVEKTKLQELTFEGLRLLLDLYKKEAIATYLELTPEEIEHLSSEKVDALLLSKDLLLSLCVGLVQVLYSSSKEDVISNERILSVVNPEDGSILDFTCPGLLDRMKVDFMEIFVVLKGNKILLLERDFETADPGDVVSFYIFEGVKSQAVLEITPKTTKE